MLVKMLVEMLAREAHVIDLRTFTTEPRSFPRSCHSRKLASFTSECRLHA
jgi:hypothetical protein